MPIFSKGRRNYEFYDASEFCEDNLIGPTVGEFANKIGHGPNIGMLSKDIKNTTSLATAPVQDHANIGGSTRKEKSNRVSSNISVDSTSKVKEESNTAYNKMDCEHINTAIEMAVLHAGIVTKHQINIAKRNKYYTGIRLWTALIELGFTSEVHILPIVAEAYNVEYISMDNVAFDQQIIQMLPKDVALQYNMVPMRIEDDILHIIAADMDECLSKEELKRYFHDISGVYLYIAYEPKIHSAILRYHEQSMSLTDIIQEIVDSEQNESYEDDSIVRFIDAMLFDAINKRASDIHLEPEAEFARIRYRIDGELLEILDCHKEYWIPMVARIKVLSDINIAEKRKPQDGRFSYSLTGTKINLRVSTQPTIHGENLVIRILDSARDLLNISKLGLTDEQKKVLSKMLLRPDGIVIVTGPTGSGKTTTLYSILQSISKSNVNILTLEDPVEYQLPMIRQTNVKDEIIDFASGIKSALRQDPDVIFVGEVRDSDAAKMTIRSAMTGHRVFTTLHTNDAISSIFRLMDLGIEPSLMSGTITCCISQRLLRKLCNNCKKRKKPTKEERKILGLKSNSRVDIFTATGCDKCCGAGYIGRTAVYEMLEIDERLDNMISLREPRNKMIKYAHTMGFKDMSDNAIQLVLDGITDIEEVISKVNMMKRL